MSIRTYDHKKDRKEVQRIWRECGWLESGKEAIFDEFVNDQFALVADIDGAVECFAVSTVGTMRYLKEDLPAAFITGVTTGRIARKQGLAAELTAELIGQKADAGAAVASLGMFEQGFYNRLGFGTCSYEHWVSFDPSKLKVDRKARIPRRLDLEDGETIHASRLHRIMRHGHCNLEGACITSAELKWGSNSFGLGYFDAPGKALSHHFCADASNVEYGPYRIGWMAYRNYSEFLELMALIRNLGDQVKLVTMREPRGIHFQDLLEQPFHNRIITEKSEFEQHIKATAYYQLRICDLRQCISQTHLPGKTLDFNITLSDPIEKYLKNRGGWTGISGDYIVHLGPESTIQTGSDPSLPVLKCSVNAFTRLWMGIVPASGLAVTDDFVAPFDLLIRLDELLRLPVPSPDWDF